MTVVEQSRPWHSSWPEGIPYDIDIPDMNLIDFLSQHLPQKANQPFLHFLDQSWTLGQVYSDIQYLAAFLASKGVTSHDIVAILMPNSPQFFIAFFAAQYLGAIVAPLNILFVEAEYKFQLNDSHASVIIAHDFLYDKVIPIKKETPVKIAITTSVGDVLPAVKSFLGKKLGKIPISKLRDPDAIAWRQALQEGKKLTIPPSTKKHPDDCALLIYTGGTTGFPKGAMQTHRNITFMSKFQGIWAPERLQSEKDAFLGALPFFHSYGSMIMMNAAYYAARLILIPNPRDTEFVLAQASKYKASYFPGVPTLYISLLNHPKIAKYDLTSIKFCLSGAAPLPVEVQNKFESTTHAHVVEGYGLTETSPVATANPLDKSKRKVGSIGIPICNTDIKTVDIETKNELPQGEIGELVIKGPQVMKAYWNKPEETAKVIKDGWFYTGDIGYMDKDGFFFIVDRLKDMIIVSGYKVFPRDVEEALYKHPAVQQAAVIGVPDPRTTERVKAYVQLKEGSTATTDELMEFCHQNLAKYRVPKEIEIRKTLPISAVGKVLRRELKQEEMKRSS